MTTALDIIQGALRKIGAYAVGETLTGEDSSSALEQLNALLDIWSTEHLTVFNNVENVLTFNPGQSTYTIGIGGNFNIDRPLRISGAYTRLSATGSSVDYPCNEIDYDQYAAIGLKSQPGPWPKVMYYNTSYPLAELIVWPVPSMGSEFHFWTDMLFSVFPDLTTPVSLPQGYILGLQTNLALLLAPEYGTEPSPSLVEQARMTKKAIKAVNMTPVGISGYDGAIVAGNGNDAGFILHGGF
jgi:hypothetical protein